MERNVAPQMPDCTVGAPRSIGLKYLSLRGLKAQPCCARSPVGRKHMIHRSAVTLSSIQSCFESFFFSQATHDSNSRGTTEKAFAVTSRLTRISGGRRSEGHLQFKV